MKPYDLSDRLVLFSADTIRYVAKVPENGVTKKITDQLLRSVMSVGANYEEAKGTDSRADFCHKLQIALKEMRETRYWLCLLADLRLTDDSSVDSLVDEATQLRAILGKSVATSRGKAKSESEKAIPF
jgi:four helix bundle protein